MQRITTDTRTSIGRRNIHPLRKSPYQGDTGRTAFRIHPRTGAVQRMQLYEPNASLLKAGAFRSIASAFPVKKLHPNSHLYTSDVLVESFPGRAFHIISQCSLNKKELKESLGDLKKANITVRNFPATCAELRKRIKLSEGGDTYLFASTLNNGQKVLIRCEKA